jgi:hypothetical protein
MGSTESYGVVKNDEDERKFPGTFLLRFIVANPSALVRVRSAICLVLYSRIFPIVNLNNITFMFQYIA